MGSILGTVLAGVGLATAFGAIVLLLRASGLTGGTAAGSLALAAAAVFLVGIFTFGYGVGKRATY